MSRVWGLRRKGLWFGGLGLIRFEGLRLQGQGCTGSALNPKPERVSRSERLRASASEVGATFFGIGGWILL